MADTGKFGGGRAAQFGDRISPGTGDGGHCAQCEAMLADALDGTLSSADQVLFDTHMATCGPCGDMLADARRGAAWLEMLRDPRPEPPAELLERILAQTSGLAIGTALALPGTDPVVATAHSPRAVVIPFRHRFAEGVRHNFGMHGLLQPRLAMTAAMAFFSIALTMNLTGLRLTELRTADLKPSNIKQSFYSAKARVVRNYEGLRVVYELESRVHDLQSDTDNSGSPAVQQAPPDRGGSEQPSDSPDQTSPEPSKPVTKAPGPGSSQRESLMPSARFVAVNAPLFSQQQMVLMRSMRRTSTIQDEWIDVRKVRALA